MSALVVTTAGCGGQRGPDYRVLELARVSGTVTLDGEPLSGARVEFVEADKQPPRLCAGETDGSGYYKVFRDRNVPGCLPGEMVIRITGSQASEESGRSDDPLKLPSRYNRASELRETVEPNGTHTFDFNLSSN